MRLYSLHLEILEILLAWKTHLRGISCVMHNYNNFHSQTISCRPKNSKPRNQKKKKKHCAQGFLAFDTQ
jgi:hypothetical protein